MRELQYKRICLALCGVLNVCCLLERQAHYWLHHLTTIHSFTSLCRWQVAPKEDDDDDDDDGEEGDEDEEVSHCDIGNKFKRCLLGDY